MGIKEFIAKKVLKNQLKKSGLTEDMQDKMLNVVLKNPELFKKIGEEIQHEIKNGKGQQEASFAVMRKYQGELQKLMQ